MITKENFLKKTGMTEEGLEEVFETLNAIRESNRVNMLECLALLRDEFNLRYDEARQLFVLWTQTLKPDTVDS